MSLIKQSTVFGGLGGVLGGVAFGLAGYILCSDSGGAMGSVLFLLLPFMVGVSIALFTPTGEKIFASVISVTIGVLILVLMSKAEGIVCCFLAWPLVLLGIAIGSWIGHVIKKYFLSGKSHEPLLKAIFVSILPFVLIGAYKIETPFRRQARTEIIVSEAWIHSDPKKVWEKVKAMEKFEGHRPFLMRLGLPQSVSRIRDFCRTAQGVTDVPL